MKNTVLHEKGWRIKEIFFFLDDCEEEFECGGLGKTYLSKDRLG
jgi:hypothetical protein